MITRQLIPNSQNLSDQFFFIVFVNQRVQLVYPASNSIMVDLPTTFPSPPFLRTIIR